MIEASVQRLRKNIKRGLAKPGVGLTAVACLLVGSMHLHAQERIKPTCVETQNERKCWVDHGPSTGPKVSPVNPPLRHLSHPLKPQSLRPPLLNHLLTSIRTGSVGTSFLPVASISELDHSRYVSGRSCVRVHQRRNSLATSTHRRRRSSAWSMPKTRLT